MIPLYKPFMPEELPEMNAILHSGALAYGKWGREFEKSLEAYTGAPHVAVVNSFNAAVQIALLTLGIGYDDEVITSPQSCLASNMPISTRVPGLCLQIVCGKSSPPRRKPFSIIIIAATLAI